jgi:hypothetical protein
MEKMSNSARVAIQAVDLHSAYDLTRRKNNKRSHFCDYALTSA